MAKTPKARMTPAEYRTSLKEDQIQAQVVQELERFAPLDAWWYHVPNGGYRKATEAARMKAQGVVPGVPDLMIHYAGEAFALELKTTKGKLSAHQKLELYKADQAGVHTAVAYGLDEALAQLRSWGLLTDKPRRYGAITSIEQIQEAAE